MITIWGGGPYRATASCRSETALKNNTANQKMFFCFKDVLLVKKDVLNGQTYNSLPPKGK
jgi:hypothetical protein